MKFITEQYAHFENGEMKFSEAKIRKATLVDELIYSDRLSLYERRAISEQQEENFKLKEENEELKEAVKESTHDNQELREELNELKWEIVLNKLNQAKWDC